MRRVVMAVVMVAVLLLVSSGNILQAQSKEDIAGYIQKIKDANYSPQVFSSLGRWLFHCWILKLQAQGKASEELGVLYVRAMLAMEAKDEAKWNETVPQLLKELIKCEEGKATNIYNGEITKEEVEGFFSQVKRDPTTSATFEQRKKEAERIYYLVIKNGYFTDPELTKAKEVFDGASKEGKQDEAAALLDKMVGLMSKVYSGGKDILITKLTDLITFPAEANSTPTTPENVLERVNKMVAVVQFYNGKGLDTSTFPPVSRRELLNRVFPSISDDFKKTLPTGISGLSQLKVSPEDKEALCTLFPDIVSHDLYLQGRERLGRNQYCDLSATLVNLLPEYYPEVGEWFERDLGRTFMEAWFLFPEGLAPDIAFAIDIEIREGNTEYKTIPQSAHMALIYFYPNGKGAVFWGNEENIKGKVGFQDIFQHFFDTGVTLKPNTWYKLGVEADFKKMKFVKFTMEGPGVKKVVDISKFNVSLPMLSSSPFPMRILEFYVGADKIGFEPGKTVVYIDDVKGGVETAKGDKIIYEDGFEKQSEVFLDIRVTNPSLLTLDIPTIHKLWLEEQKTHGGRWILEREDGKALIGKAPAAPVRHGSQSLIFDTSILIMRDPLIREQTEKK